MGLTDRQENIAMVRNKTLRSTLNIRWDCSPIAPPLLVPMQYLPLVTSYQGSMLTLYNNPSYQLNMQVTMMYYIQEDCVMTIINSVRDIEL